MKVLWKNPPCHKCRYSTPGGECWGHLKKFDQRSRQCTRFKLGKLPEPFPGRRVIRVFPRATRATPDDELAVVGRGPLAHESADEVHVSVAWTWDLPEAERLEKLWKPVAEVKVGGPALGTKGEDFVAGAYLKQGYTITSRGCPNRCWFCSVWKREGREVRELPIVEGYNVLDDNLLACSDAHVKKVFAMLRRTAREAEFSGGLEAARLKPWHVDELSRLRVNQIFFAYDTPDDWEPLVEALRMLKEAGFTRHKLRVYTLIGYPKDTVWEAEDRLESVVRLGAFPAAMLYDRKPSEPWRQLQRLWMRPSLIHAAL